MAIPGENYVLRLREGTTTSLVQMTVLDIGVSGVADPVVLVAWGFGARASVDFAGFSLIRFDISGNIVWQVSRTLCTFSGIDCGKYQLDEGALARTPDGFIIAGTGLNIDTGAPKMFTMRVDDFGAVKWAKSYAPTPAALFPGRITSIAPMSAPDRYLIAARSDIDTWMFQIDGNGGAISAALFPWTRVRRLRATPTQGICAVGEFYSSESEWINAGIINFDPMTGAVRWARNYYYGLEGSDYGMRWYDIAEGDDAFLVVGNQISLITEKWPMLAFLAKDMPAPAAAGSVLWASIPAIGTEPVRLRGVANHQDDIIPLGPDGRNSIFVVTGDVNQQPWCFAIGEDRIVQWQKTLRTMPGFQGKLAPVVWPSFEEIVAGGETLVGGDISRGLLMSSPVTNFRGISNCSTESAVAFPDQVLYSSRPTPTTEPLVITTLDCYVDQATDLLVTKGCLDLQQSRARAV